MHGRLCGIDLHEFPRPARGERAVGASDIACAVPSRLGFPVERLPAGQFPEEPGHLIGGEAHFEAGVPEACLRQSRQHGVVDSGSVGLFGNELLQDLAHVVG